MFYDRIAENKFSQLKQQFGFELCIETGTNEGYGALNASKYCRSVITCEINEGYRDKALLKWLHAGYTLRPYTDTVMADRDDRFICSYLKSSHLLLPEILPSLLPKPVCFYLDAHWGEYFPLPDELKSIAQWPGRTNCVIIIHDCKVPGKDFMYDSYHGHAISYEYLKDWLSAINPDFKISYNESYEAKEPGHPVGQGIMYCTP